MIYNWNLKKNELVYFDISSANAKLKFVSIALLFDLFLVYLNIWQFEFKNIYILSTKNVLYNLKLLYKAIDTISDSVNAVSSNS